MAGKKSSIFKKTKALCMKHKIASILIIIAAIIIISIITVEVFLYIQFVIGHDIVVRLESDRIDIQLEKGQQETVTFRASSVANPFCRISCEYSFFDISKNSGVDSGYFITRSQIIREISYNISSGKLGTGQELYRFSIKCHNLKGFMCHTNEEETKRNALLSVEYGLNDQDKKLREELRESVEIHANTFREINASIINLKRAVETLGAALIIKDSEEMLETIEKELIWVDSRISRETALWEEQDYSGLKKESDALNKSVAWLEKDFSYFKESIQSNVTGYNEIIAEIEDAKKYFENLGEIELNETDALEAESRIRAFNALAGLLNEKGNYSEKKRIAKNILETNISGFFSKSYINDTMRRVNESVEFNISRITIEEAPPCPLFILDEPLPQCCVFGDCHPCCNGKQTERYPVVFLHGHSFDKEVSADYSLNVFDDIQEKLEEHGYLNVGETSLYTMLRKEPGILGMSCMPVTVRASYYFDVLRVSRDYMAIQAKSENIDTYSIRLRDIISNLKYETGQEKVTIVAHSMGGLVARRYIQIFGAESVDKLVLISVPNKGITGNVKSYCSFFGAQLECRDMDSESLFINKLNNQGMPEVETYNIVGTGCRMDEGLGDGVVLENNAYLEGARNYIINGSCSGTSLLHGEILGLDKYPEFYNAIRGIFEI